jgi:hypothetical protein
MESEFGRQPWESEHQSRKDCVSRTLLASNPEVDAWQGDF